MRRIPRLPPSSIILLGMALSSAGCASLMATAQPDWNYTDPPHLDPTYRPLTTPTPAPQTLGRPAGELPPGGQLPPADRSSGPVPETVAPPGISGDEPAGGPQLASPAIAAPVELTVEAPSRKQVGSAIEFRLGVRNSGEAAAENVAVEVEFDDGLIFPGRAERQVSQSLGRLLPGEPREVALTLVAGRTGTLCARFLVTVGETEAAWKSVCVEVVPRQLQLEIVGPPQRTIGSRAEFTIKLVNASSEVLAGVQATATYDAALTPREGSAGAQQKPGSVSWNLGDLQPGEGVHLQLEFECRVASESACLTAEVTGTGIPSERLEKCLRVIPRQGSVDVQVLDRLDPVKLGDETEYVVTVQNRDLRAVRGLAFSADVPRELEIVSTELNQNGRPLPVRADVKDGQVAFEAVDTLAPDDVLTYHIRVRALATGDASFAARLTHSGSPEPVEVVEPTTVIRP